MTELHSAALMIVTGTGAILSFTLFWGLGNSRPLRNRRVVTGRAAAPYWHAPSGIADERGITARIEAGRAVDQL